MSCINADDELFAPIAGKLHFQLKPLVRLRPRPPFFPCNRIVEPLADPDGALAHRRMGLGRFDRQNPESTFAACRYGIMLPSRAVSSINSGVARSGRISCNGAKAATMPGQQSWQSIQRGLRTFTAPETVRIRRWYSP